MRRYKVAWKIPSGSFKEAIPGSWFSRNEARDLAWRFLEMGAEIAVPVWVTLTFTPEEGHSLSYSADLGDHDIQGAIESEFKRREAERA